MMTKTTDELESENKSLRHIIQAWKADKDVRKELEVARVELHTLRFKTSEQERFIWWAWNVLAPNILNTASAIIVACTYQDEQGAKAGKYGLPKSCFDALEQLIKQAKRITDGTYLNTTISTCVKTSPDNNKDEICIWVEVDDPDVTYWATSCKEEFYLDTGTPGDNHMNYCCYCGKRLVESKYD